MFLQDRAGGGQRIVTSASDLTAASACEFAFLRRVDARLGRDVDVPADDDPMLARAARLGDAHEERTLAGYRDELGRAVPDRAGGVCEIPRPDSMRESDLEEVGERTRDALRSQADVVFQATFFEPVQRADAPLPGPRETAAAAGEPDEGAGAGDDIEIGFVGFADFLRRQDDGSYEVQDTKLARRTKATALMQLAAYAEQLERIGIAASPEAVLILGDGSRSVHRIADIAPVFRARRRRLHRLLRERVAVTGSDGLRSSAAPVAWGAEGVAACGRCEVCAPEIERTRDPLLIAGISRAQRDALIAAGCDTIDAVAALLPSVTGLDGDALDNSDCIALPPSLERDFAPEIEGVRAKTLVRLVAQAQVQTEAQPGQAPPVRVIDPEALAAIPQPNAGDLFFDFEGDPMYRAPSAEGDERARWGLDYLFGMVDMHESFTPLWAHDLDAERAALEQFLALVARRRAQYPGMKIYHYAAYERTHLLSIAARHGVGEAAVDQLLREHVLVDLYPIVRRALRVGSRSYSIKKLEPLYMGSELRDADGVTNGAESVTEYAEASTQLTSNDPAERAIGQRRLDAIADYNRYDCVSTLRLRDWLLSLAAAHGVQPYLANPAADDLAVDGPDFEPSTVAGALAMHAALAAEPADRTAVALAAAAIDYHAREQKSFWWAHFARLVDPIEDWADTRDVLIIDDVHSGPVANWFLPERARTARRHLLLRGDLAPGSSLKEGSEGYLLYDYPAPFPTPGAEPGSRGARRVKILQRRDDGVVIEEFLGKGIESYDEMPVALVPGPPPNAGRQTGAIEEWGSSLATALDLGGFPKDPVVDLLRRTPPRAVGCSEAMTDEAGYGSAGYVTGAAGDARPAAVPRDNIAEVTERVRRLDRSYLAVQGPPGTGKTYLAARVIKQLVEEDGWRIGVVAQSHRVVENVLEGVVGAGLDPELVGKVPQGGQLLPEQPEPPYTVLRKDTHDWFLRQHRAAGRGAVIGGTAWDFAHDGRIARRSLDLLVIDEAGQFSLAPTIAASVAAERLLLLGDPQQLPQVSQGSHPEPVDTSALGWLLGEHGTIPEALGVFLAETRRMRPELTAVVSELSYEGRLVAHPSASDRVVTGAGSPGLNWHPVAHRGNVTHSPEEAATVVRLVEQSLRGRQTVAGSAPRGLDQHDVIVVAAYNAQVECVSETLAAAGFSRVRVGTVDKFQGQEAAIAIVTLAASSLEDAPRGIEFLLMRNRLNVAISRAQWAAHLLSSPDLGEGLPTSAEGMAALSGYLRLLERAVRIDSGAPEAGVGADPVGGAGTDSVAGTGTEAGVDPVVAGEPR